MDRLARGFVFLFDVFVVSDDVDGVLGFLGIRLDQGNLNRPDALRVFGFLYREFVVVAVAAAPQLLEVIAVVGDQPAHHVHVAHAAVQLPFGGLQVRLGRFQVLLRAPDFACHRANLFLARLDLGSELLV